MYTDSGGFGKSVDRPMDLTAVAEHQDIREIMALYDFTVPIAHFTCCSAVIPGLLASGVNQIATAKVHPAHRMPAKVQRISDMAKEGRSRALQRKEGTTHVNEITA